VIFCEISFPASKYLTIDGVNLFRGAALPGGCKLFVAYSKDYAPVRGQYKLNVTDPESLKAAGFKHNP
jgi:hypothetical protein